ncbi:mediator of RNA polymerase II transcription subunit 6 [Pelomyxa schiedti]|nr:mediator of RNA polymerase II transcription subunit 6 [Pelomyxa schiedti]
MMDTPPVVVPGGYHEEQLAEVFRDEMWLEESGGVNFDNVLDYFARSQFYTRNCLNEEARRQAEALVKTSNSHRATPMTQEEFVRCMRDQEADTFRRFSSGTEFSKSQQSPQLFVIRKLERKTENDVASHSLLAVYYVVNGSIYQAPDLNTLVCSRMNKTFSHLHSAMVELQKSIHFHPAKNVTWDWTPEAKPASICPTLTKAENTALVDNFMKRYEHFSKS